MPAVNVARLRAALSAFDWKTMFVEELGWNRARERRAPVMAHGRTWNLSAVAEQGGMYVYVCRSEDGTLPTHQQRTAIEREVTKDAYEHILIFEDAAQTEAIFQWIKRGEGGARSREYPYRRGQNGELLVQRLSGIAFDWNDLDEEGRINIATVAERVRKALDADPVVKRFYRDFERQRDQFQKFLQGIPIEDDQRWYVSVMLNRLMFISFIQAKRFLNNDGQYLQHQLEASQARGADRFYREFLRALFFQGFAVPKEERDPATQRLLGNIPYLNGGLFLPHPIEERYGDAIDVPDRAFAELFAFFSQWRWHLSERPNTEQNEIDPDVLGYIFEKYINNKQMGAYYTKEDITGYICRNTIVPALFDKANLSLAPLKLAENIEKYIYPAVKQIDRLPTETDREYAARHARKERLIADARSGKISTINDVITANLNIEAIAFDLIWELPARDLMRFYEAISTLSVLDPTCGSGAFLFAAIKVLKPLYEIALDRMALLRERRRTESMPFDEILRAENAHANREYFVTKSIIVRNLYGVDIMEEATEVCKLRLFLRLVADLDDAEHIEPLPDIDFNIRAGNALVGYVRAEEIGGVVTSKGLAGLSPRQQQLVRAVQATQRKLAGYRSAQLEINPSSDAFRQTRREVQAELAAVNAALDDDLLRTGQITKAADGQYNTQPFHWFTAFYEILDNGGFDVIVGNPPYVEYSKVRGDKRVNGEEKYKIYGYETEPCGNLYAFLMERSLRMIRTDGYFGMIVPLSSVSTDRAISLQNLFLHRTATMYLSSFDVYPAKLFEGAKQRLTIFIAKKMKFVQSSQVFSTKYIRWYPPERATLLETMHYADISGLITAGVFPKVDTDLQKQILSKMSSGSLESTLTSAENNVFYCHRIPYNFIKAVDFVPFFRSERDGEKRSEDYKVFSATSSLLKNVTIAILNSSTFFWWWYSFSEGYHCGRGEIKSFPINLNTMGSANQHKLADLACTLMGDLQRNSKMKHAQYKTTGSVQYQEFYPRFSKPIIDEIDRVLAQHYGFTAEELDFIINYDIKYRMGRDSDDES